MNIFHLSQTREEEATFLNINVSCSTLSNKINKYKVFPWKIYAVWSYFCFRCFCGDYTWSYAINNHVWIKRIINKHIKKGNLKKKMPSIFKILHWPPTRRSIREGLIAHLIDTVSFSKKKSRHVPRQLFNYIKKFAKYVTSVICIRKT